MNETPDTAQRPAQPVVATGPLFGRAKKHVEETILWKHWSNELPEFDETLLLMTSDGEVLPGFYTLNERDEPVWRREYWPQPQSDKLDRDVIAWAQWPDGPVDLPNIAAQPTARTEPRIHG